MMANMMGSYGFWIKNGVVEEKGLVCSFIVSHVASANYHTVR